MQREQPVIARVVRGDHVRTRGARVARRARMTRIVWLAALAACAGSATTAPGSGTGGGKADGDGGDATLAFHGDFTETTTGTLVAGTTVRVTYDLSRLQTCRAESDGIAVWGVTGFAQFDDGTTVSFALSQPDGVDVTPIDGEVELPASATHVSLWFQATNEWGCNAYDSDYGANYTFALASSGAQAVLEFASDPSAAPTQSAALHAGDEVVVHYEPDRLAQCYALSNEMPAWGITLYWQLDGGAVNSTSASRVDGDVLVAADPTIPVTGGSDLALWFEATSVYGCDAYDSAYGANYHFQIQ
jgi:hypothetical protein